MNRRILVRHQVGFAITKGDYVGCTSCIAAYLNQISRLSGLTYKTMECMAPCGMDYPGCEEENGRK